jgi:hypothetical protein
MASMRLTRVIEAAVGALASSCWPLVDPQGLTSEPHTNPSHRLTAVAVAAALPVLQHRASSHHHSGALAGVRTQEAAACAAPWQAHPRLA